MKNKRCDNTYKNRRGKILGIFLLALSLFMIGCGDTTGTQDSAQTSQTTERASSLMTEQAVTEDSETTQPVDSEQVSETESETQEPTSTQADLTADDQAVDEGLTDSTLQVHYVDVGQGDCTLITCDGHAMLIDAGNNNKGTAVQAYLQSQGIEELDYAIGTHPDADHVGGLDVVITKFTCDTVLLNNENKDTDTYRDVLDAITYRGCQQIAPSVGDEFNLGSAKFTIVGPSSIGSDSNNNSIALILHHGDNSFYFEGDAESEEEDILAAGISVAADVYKIGHHGSGTSTSDAMLGAVNPEYAVISAGEGNSYGHPHAEVLNKLREKGVQVFRTDEQGTIVATSDGINITWNCSPSTSWQAGENTSNSQTAQSNESAITDTSDNVATGDEADAGAIVDSGDTSSAVMVHITETGSKYHSAGCQYLKSSDIEVTLEQAKANGLTPCSKCNPPQ